MVEFFCRCHLYNMKLVISNVQLYYHTISRHICFYRWSVYTLFENNRSKLFSEILPPFIWISSLLFNGRQSASQSVITTLLGCRIGLLNVKTKDKHDDGEWSLDTSTHRVGDGHLEIILFNLMILLHKVQLFWPNGWEFFF